MILSADLDCRLPAAKIRSRLRTAVVLFRALGFLVAGNFSTFAAEGRATGCVLLEQQGKVEVARRGSAVWTQAEANEVLQVGDRLRTALHSRATLRWSES